MAPHWKDLPKWGVFIHPNLISAKIQTAIQRTWIKPLSLWVKSYSVAIEIKATELSILAVLFNFTSANLRKVVTFVYWNSYKVKQKPCSNS